MHEFKHGELPSGSGAKVKNPRQAIAIALSEAGASNQQSPAENRKKLRQTRKGESRDALYQQAQKAEIPGRSKMNKGELQRALARH